MRNDDAQIVEAAGDLLYLLSVHSGKSGVVPSGCGHCQTATLDALTAAIARGAEDERVKIVALLRHDASEWVEQTRGYPENTLEFQAAHNAASAVYSMAFRIEEGS